MSLIWFAFKEKYLRSYKNKQIAFGCCSYFRQQGSLTCITKPSRDENDPHLVQGGLGHRIIFYPEELFVLSEDAEDVSEGREGRGELVL